jgi:tryptophan 7-halogenase
MINENELIKKIIVVGGGTAGWMSATYLAQSLNFKLDITVIEAPGQPPIGVGEATIPTIKSEFFDRLGIKEEEWMPQLTGTFKLGIKYANWKIPKEQGGDHYYHIFGEIPLIDEVPLSHVWIKKRLEDKHYRKPMANACFSTVFAFDKNLSPKYFDGTQVQHYAYHFDALLLAQFLKKWGTARGIKHVVDTLVTAERDEQGNITCVVSDTGKKYEADLFIDCSGFNSFLLEKILNEPIISFADSLLTDRAIAVNIPDLPDNKEIRSYTSATALKAGWVWEIPLFKRSGNGYVYSSQFISDDEAERELREHFGEERLKDVKFRPIKFESRRHTRAWVKNCVAIGLSSSFLEPLESSTIYFIYAALYQLVKNFPHKQIDPILRDKFNEKVTFMVEDNKDFIVMHFKTAQREDTPFWKANKYETKVPDSLATILARHKSGLPIRTPIVSNDNLYPTFKSLFENFWTNTNYQCILCGVGYLPDTAYPLLDHREADIMRIGQQMFEEIEKESERLAKNLPTHYEYLKRLNQA